jgi:thioredoxin-dependent peroxiredoxin
MWWERTAAHAADADPDWPLRSSVDSARARTAASTTDGSARAFHDRSGAERNAECLDIGIIQSSTEEDSASDEGRTPEGEVSIGGAMHRVHSIAALFLVTAPLAFAACHDNPPSPSAPVASSSASAASAGKPPVAGDDAPALSVTASNGTKVDLAAMRGQYVVVYFYPKDDTPGCTKEACAFRDAYEKLAKAKIAVIGVSLDNDESHRAFADKYKLNFSLVSDKDGAIAAKFGVPVNEGYASRVSFLIGPDGKVKKVYPKVDPIIHADEVLKDAGG